MLLDLIQLGLALAIALPCVGLISYVSPRLIR